MSKCQWSSTLRPQRFVNVSVTWTFCPFHYILVDGNECNPNVHEAFNVVHVPIHQSLNIFYNCLFMSYVVIVTKLYYYYYFLCKHNFPIEIWYNIQFEYQIDMIKKSYTFWIHSFSFVTILYKDCFFLVSYAWPNF